MSSGGTSGAARSYSFLGPQSPTKPQGPPIPGLGIKKKYTSLQKPANISPAKDERLDTKKFYANKTVTGIRTISSLSSASSSSRASPRATGILSSRGDQRDRNKSSQDRDVFSPAESGSRTPAVYTERKKRIEIRKRQAQGLDPRVSRDKFIKTRRSGDDDDDAYDDAETIESSLFPPKSRASTPIDLSDDDFDTSIGNVSKNRPAVDHNKDFIKSLSVEKAHSEINLLKEKRYQMPSKPALPRITDLPQIEKPKTIAGKTRLHKDPNTSSKTQPIRQSSRSILQKTSNSKSRGSSGPDITTLLSSKSSKTVSSDVKDSDDDGDVSILSHERIPSSPAAKKQNKRTQPTAKKTRKRKGADTSSESSPEVVDGEADSDDDLFTAESAAVTAAREKALTELAKANGNTFQKYLDKDQQKTWSQSKRSSSRTKKLTKLIDDDSGDFLKTIRSTKVYIPKDQTSDHEDNIDLDLDADMSLGFKNNYEEMDESVNITKQTRIVKKKYEGREYPGSLTESELENAVNQHMDCVPRILSGTEGSTYYNRAKEVMSASHSTTISNADFHRMSLDKFIIGFYGIKRQSSIASLIKKKYGKKVEEYSEFNKTVQFWSIDLFVLHVLACDVAARMAAEGLDISLDEAIEVLEKTVDYGKYLTDATLNEYGLDE